MTVEEKVREVLVYHLGCNPEQVKLESNLIDDLGADSLDCLEIVMNFEDQLNILISDEEADAIRTVGDIVDLITPRIGKGHGPYKT